MFYCKEILLCMDFVYIRIGWIGGWFGIVFSVSVIISVIVDRCGYLNVFLKSGIGFF